MTRQDWLLLILNAGDYPLTPVQLQKAAFLLSERLKPEVGEDFYKFVPYNYGPFASELYTDSEQLASLGLATIEKSKDGYLIYGATGDGSKKAQEISESLPERSSAFVKTVVDWVQSLTFTQLLKSIYAEFPQYKERSVFRY